MKHLSTITGGKTGRCSSWDRSGRNDDAWNIEPGETRVLADITGPGAITHIWMTQRDHYREVMLKITWDNASKPSVLVPLGDFFCLGHGIVNSFQSMLFTASTSSNNRIAGCALNCYVRMPFKERALVELVNESSEVHRQYFYVDYERYDDPAAIDGEGYFHAEFRRENPFGGWGHEILVNRPEADIANTDRLAWENNHVIVEASGASGHYIGCNISITNFQGTWWGEGDDMIWVDGFKWPPDLHGTGSEDYLNQAWGMQPNAFLRNGSSIFEHHTGGYQTSYVFHLENPVRFTRDIKVTIEHGHGNHLRNEVSSVGYYYASRPLAVKEPPPVGKRLRVLKDARGAWIQDPAGQVTSKEIMPNTEMLASKRRWKGKNFPAHVHQEGTLVIDDRGAPCLDTRLSPQNPEVYRIPMEELLEWFQGKHVVLLVAGTERARGTLASGTASGITIGTMPLKDAVPGHAGARVILETLQEFGDGDVVSGHVISIDPVH